MLKITGKIQFLILFILFSKPVFSQDIMVRGSDCHPSVDNNVPQFIIGYGSLMQEKSKREEDPDAGENYPIYLTGYERGWIEKGRPIGFSTTYLGIKRKTDSRINAVYFKVSHVKAIDLYDRREDSYCRMNVPSKSIQFLNTKAPKEGQFWIYVTMDDSKHTVSPDYPIVQSYVDIFLSGCFELEKKYHLSNFAKDCVKTTINWSAHWVNDRVYPRTAADNAPYVYEIDSLISKELPEYFKHITIE